MKLATLSYIRVILKPAQASATTKGTKSSSCSQCPWPNGTLANLSRQVALKCICADQYNSFWKCFGPNFPSK